MKKFTVSVFLMLVVSVFSNVFGQRETPAGAGDKNLGDDGIKLRSVELERVKRDANKNDPATFAPINKDIKAKFPQIKEDFESIQIAEAAIIKAYTTGKTIDYNMIQTSAENINKKAKRLDDNLFATKLEKKGDKKEKEQKPKTIKELIVDLDHSIGNFVSSKIFGNINVVETDVAIKTRTDLVKILDLSEKLSKEAGKMK